MEILLTGATGFVGRALGNELVRGGHSLTVFTRDPQKAALPYPARIFAWDSEVDLRNIDVVIHLAGESIANRRWTVKQKEKILQSRSLSTRKLIEKLLQGEARPKVFLASSAIGFYGDRADELLSEEAKPGSDFLAEVCIAWEREIAVSKKLGSRVVILRLGMVLGKGGGALEKIIPLFQKGLGGKLGNGKQWVSWIHREDLVRLFIHAIDGMQIEGVYNAVAPVPVTNQEFTDQIAEVLNVPAIMAAPKFILRLVLGEMSELLLNSQRVSANKIVNEGFPFRYPQFSAAIRQIIQSDQ